MPITVSYDLKDADPNERNYVRSLLERFGWTRLGGSVFRYEADTEDWLNDVVPALMLFRSYIVAKNIKLNYFTLDTHSVARIDLTDSEAELGYKPETGKDIFLYEPTNVQSSEKRLRRGVDQLIDLFKAPGDD